MIEDLSSYRRTIERIRSNWAAFLAKRSERLKQQERYGNAAEKVTENILEDLFTNVLDWTLADINNQIRHADLILTSLGIKRLVLEAKRPGALAWNERGVDAALGQVTRYASEQKVKCIGISDGVMLYAADIQHGGRQDRVFVSLDSTEPPEQLWWLSVDGIWRPRENRPDAVLRLLPEEKVEALRVAEPGADWLIHPKYKLPSHCFAYIGDAANVKTWKLPYLLADGSADIKRLPKAIQAILSNYRGEKVSGLNEKDIPDVLGRLARAAVKLGKMPHQCGEAAPVYAQLAEVLDQLGRMREIML
ncbi:MAG: hypothetical protein M0Z48_05105 [Nitrospiraceae bacterium]|nr:hypothetical protein [Nitrospiraceae bacterium]